MRTTPEAISDANRDRVAEYLRRNVARAEPSAPSIPRRSPNERVPLSIAQEQVWLHAQMAPDVPVYNEAVTIHYTGNLDVAALERSFNEILRRHEIWRTSFQVVDGRPEQIIHPTVSVSLAVVDLRSLPATRREIEASRIATEDAIHPLDLTKAPSIKARLIRLAEEQYRLYLTLSHIIFDGVAIYRVFLPELAALYAAYSCGRPSPLSEPLIQYGDYSIWQRRCLQPERVADQMSYWRRQLHGDLPVLNLPCDRSRPPLQTFRGAMYPFRIDRDLMRDVKLLAAREGATLFQFLLTAFAVLLLRYTGSDDIPIGTVTSGRDIPETQNLLGYFLNTVVLRLDLSGSVSFREVLRRVRQTVVEALMHDVVPFGQIVQELRIPRDPSRNPLFQILFSLEPPMPPLEPEWQLTQMDIDTGATKYDLYLELDERQDAILARYHYSTDLFDESTVQRMAAHLQTLLASAAAAPDTDTTHLTLLTESERNQILFNWNETRQVNPRTTIHELVEARAQADPEKIAVEFESRRLTYAELNASANRLAWHLKSLGVGPDTGVAVCVERSAELIIALLAVLKAGGAYIPIDVEYPEDRLEFVMANAKPQALVTQRALADRFSAVRNTVLMDADPGIKSQPDSNLKPSSRLENMAYVLYTSGSTGLPKGVQIEHRSFLNCLLAMKQEFSFTADDALLAITTISFDIAGLEIFLPLIAGARVVLAPHDAVRDSSKLIPLIPASRATVMQATPATWRMLVDAGWKGQPGLKILSTGDVLSGDLAQALVRRGQKVWNLYGPTETTIYSSIQPIVQPLERPVPIGRPIRNTQIYVLDRNLEPVPAGVAGEIYIGGDGVARGYLNQPELTSAKFIPNPFDAVDGARIYRTQDLGRYRADGVLEFLGRIDSQVKVRGHRVELGEIESTLPQHPSVRNAVASIRKDASGETAIVAYIVPAPETSPGAGELRDFLKRKLPGYMIPAHLVFLEELPLTPNGKVDRKLLPIPGKRAESDCDFAAARNETEARLTAIWESVLGVEHVGIYDDFWELGGHSISAVQMVALIEKHFGNSIPLATLLKAPTIAQLADALHQQGTWERESALVAIEPGGSLPAIFCVHGHFGEVLFYRPLSRLLGPQQPFFALQGVDSSAIHESIEAKAKDYLIAIRKVRPRGPYYIAGYCFGAMVAFEIAQQLQCGGEEVAFLGLFMGRDPVLSLPAKLFRKVDHFIGQWRALGAKVALKQMAMSLSTKAKTRIWEGSYRLCRNVAPALLPLFKNIQGMNVQAAKRYVPRIFPGRMTVFLSGAVWPGFQLNPRQDLYGMDAVHVDFRMIPGDRDSMMRDPFVQVLAEQLRKSLDTARAVAIR